MENSNLKKRVYFLGAGASNASEFKLPTMNEFFREGFTSEEYPSLHEFIRKIFPGTDISGLNLEDVITRLELSMDKFGAFGEHPETYLYDARREFNDYVHKRLTYEPKDGRHWCKNHKVLFEQLTDHDSIITLNYDLIIEHTLDEITKQKNRLSRMDSLLNPMNYAGLIGIPSLPRDYTGLGHYLKLHGSIGWLYCDNPSCGNHQRFFPNQIGKKVHNSPGDLCNICGSPLVSVIIPPTMSKTFDEYPKLGFLWSLAYREIRDADELVLIGMSLPDSDYYLKWLINSAIRSRKVKPLKVVAVNKDEKVCDKIYELSGIISEYWNDFCEYVNNIKKQQKNSKGGTL